MCNNHGPYNKHKDERNGACRCVLKPLLINPSEIDTNKGGCVRSSFYNNCIGFLELWNKGLTHVAHRAIFRMNSGNESVKYLA